MIPTNLVSSLPGSWECAEKMDDETDASQKTIRQPALPPCGSLWTKNKTLARRSHSARPICVRRKYKLSSRNTDMAAEGVGKASVHSKVESKRMLQESH